MYFFLANLSFLDLCFSTSCVPQMLVNFWGPDKTISYAGCVVQLRLLFPFCWRSRVPPSGYHGLWPGYAAVCKPLHYTVIMHPQLCLRLVAVAWGSGLVNAIVMSPLTMTLSRCGQRRVNHFLCEMPAPDQDGLCGRSRSGSAGLHLCRSHCPTAPPLILVSLRLHRSSCAEDQVSCWAPEGLPSIPAQLPPHCGLLVLWEHHLYVHAARKQLFPRPKASFSPSSTTW